LRIEKGYGSWGREYSPEYWPQEVGLERLIKMDKPSFLGKNSYAAVAGKPAREVLVNLSIEDSHNADASGGEPIFLPDGTPVGRVSSGAYGYTVEKSLALAFINPEHALTGTPFHVAILGIPHTAVMLDRPAFDPEGHRLRA
jgi:dimethylglycine dehydrogenase